MKLKHLLSTLLFLFCLSAYANAGKVLIQVQDLHSDAALAREAGKPIVVLFTATYCEYCETLKQAVFQFLTEDKRFILRELTHDNGKEIHDFSGEQISTYKVAKRYNATFTPTVLFLGPSGEEIAEPLVGVITLDYYAAYLDRSLDQATSKLAL